MKVGKLKLKKTVTSRQEKQIKVGLFPHFLPSDAANAVLSDPFACFLHR